MPRKPRKLSSTGIYHIMTRGIDRMAIFHDDEDREKYLEILAACLPGEPSWGTVLSESSWGTVLSVTPKVGPKNCPRSDLSSSALEDGSLVPASRDKGSRPQVQADRPQVQAILYQYCLMDNHVHLLLKTGSESLSHLMKRIGVRYAAYFKWKYHRTGHLFQDRFRSEPVEDDSYLLAVYRYIVLNPVKAGLCEKPGAYPWCGFQEPWGSDLPAAALEDGSLVPASCDKGDRPQAHDTLSPESSWGTVLSVTPEVGLKNCPRSDLTSFALEDGSLVPASRDKGSRPQVQAVASNLLHPLPVNVTREQLWDYILADAPEIHPFAERVLDGEAEALLLQYSGLNTALDVPRLTRQQQLALFYNLQEEGVSIQQMARLTGIAKTNIARWLS